MHQVHSLLCNLVQCQQANLQIFHHLSLLFNRHHLLPPSRAFFHLVNQVVLQLDNQAVDHRVNHRRLLQDNLRSSLLMNLVHNHPCSQQYHQVASPLHSQLIPLPRSLLVSHLHSQLMYQVTNHRLNHPRAHQDNRLRAHHLNPLHNPLCNPPLVQLGNQHQLRRVNRLHYRPVSLPPFLAHNQQISPQLSLRINLHLFLHLNRLVNRRRNLAFSQVLSRLGSLLLSLASNPLRNHPVSQVFNRQLNQQIILPCNPRDNRRVNHQVSLLQFLLVNPQGSLLGSQHSTLPLSRRRNPAFSQLVFHLPSQAHFHLHNLRLHQPYSQQANRPHNRPDSLQVVRLLNLLCSQAHSQARSHHQSLQHSRHYNRLANLLFNQRVNQQSSLRDSRRVSLVRYPLLNHLVFPQLSQARHPPLNLLSNLLTNHLVNRPVSQPVNRH